jgi:hypothetical protein
MNQFHEGRERAQQAAPVSRRSYKDYLRPHPAFPLPFANRTPIRLGKALGKAA